MKQVGKLFVFAMVAAAIGCVAASVSGQYVPPVRTRHPPTGTAQSDIRLISIKGQIRWKKDLGIPQYHVNPGDTACSKFELYVYEPSPSGKLLRAWHIDRDMHEDGDYYFCTYNIDGHLERDHTYHVEAGFRVPQEPLPAATDSSVWGEHVRASAASRPTRVILNPVRTVTLNVSNPAVVQDFEVVRKSEIFQPRPPLRPRN